MNLIEANPVIFSSYTFCRRASGDMEQPPGLLRLHILSIFSSQGSRIFFFFTSLFSSDILDYLKSLFRVQNRCFICRNFFHQQYHHAFFINLIVWCKRLTNSIVFRTICNPFWWYTVRIVPQKLEQCVNFGHTHKFWRSISMTKMLPLLNAIVAE